MSSVEFSMAASVLKAVGRDQIPGTREVSFYETDLGGALGRATGTFDKGGLAGLSDSYDFDPKPLFRQDSRPLAAEVKTRVMALIGKIFGGEGFEITGER